MSSRVSHLDLATISLQGSSVVAELQDITFTIDEEIADSRTVVDRHHEAEIVGRDVTIEASLFHVVGGAKKTNLDISTIGFDTTPTLAVGDVIAGTINVITNTTEGKGVADAWHYANARGTEIEGELTCLIAAGATASLFATAGGTLAGLAFTFTLVCATSGFSLTVACKISSVSKRVERQGDVELTISFVQNGVPSVASNDALMVDILTGDAVAAYAMDDGVDAISGNALITRAQYQIANGAIQSKGITLKGRGAPTFS